MIAEAVQWVGFVGIVYGYAVFGTHQIRGATCSLFGAVALVMWCFLQPVMPWGVLALQITFTGINMRYIWKGLRHG